MSIGIVALCFCLHQVVRRTDFVQFYITLCRESRKIVLEPTEDVGLVRYICFVSILFINIVEDSYYKLNGSKIL